MTISRLKPAFVCVLCACAGFALLQLVGYVSVARAATEADAGPTPVALAEPVISGPVAWLLIGFTLLLGVRELLAGFKAIMSVIAPRTKNTADDRVLEAATKLHSLTSELIDALGVRSPAALARNPQSGTISGDILGSMVALVVIVLVLGSVVGYGCSSWRQRTSAGVSAFLDCEGEHIDAGLLSEAKAVSKSAISRWVSGDGHVDTAGLKAEAAPLKSDLMRCGFAAAIAALATPVAAQPGAPAAAGLEVDGAGLRSAFIAVRSDLGWAPLRVGNGVL